MSVDNTGYLSCLRCFSLPFVHIVDRKRQLGTVVPHICFHELTVMIPVTHFVQASEKLVYFFGDFYRVYFCHCICLGNLQTPVIFWSLVAHACSLQ